MFQFKFEMFRFIIEVQACSCKH